VWVWGNTSVQPVAAPSRVSGGSAFTTARPTKRTAAKRRPSVKSAGRSSNTIRRIRKGCTAVSVSKRRSGAIDPTLKARTTRAGRVGNASTSVRSVVRRSSGIRAMLPGRSPSAANRVGASGSPRRSPVTATRTGAVGATRLRDRMGSDPQGSPRTRRLRLRPLWYRHRRPRAEPGRSPHRPGATLRRGRWPGQDERTRPR
jgi:hypothetical protein